MNTRPDSLRSLGATTINVDKPTRSRFQAAANAAGMNMLDYMRWLSNLVVSEGKQLQVPISPPVNNSAMAIERVHQMEAKFDALLKTIDSKLSLNFGVTPEEQHRRLNNNIQAVKDRVREAVQLPGKGMLDEA